MLKEKVLAFINEGIPLKQISEYSGIHYTTLSKWLNGKRELNKKNNEKVEFALKEILKRINKIME